MITFFYLLVVFINFIFTGENILPEHLKSVFELVLFMFIEYFIEMWIFMLIWERK